MSALLLHLMRHGAPEQTGLLMGRTDAVPTQAGIATCLEQATDLPITAIVSSDLLRTRYAAEAIGAPRNLPVMINRQWRELDFGDWDGQAPAAIDPAAMAAFWNDPDANAPPGGERWSDLVARVAAAIQAVEGPATLVLTHGGAMRAALSHLCGFTQVQTWAFDLPYATLLTLKLWPGPRPSAQIIGLRP